MQEMAIFWHFLCTIFSFSHRDWTKKCKKCFRSPLFSTVPPQQRGKTGGKMSANNVLFRYPPPPPFLPRKTPLFSPPPLPPLPPLKYPLFGGVKKGEIWHSGGYPLKPPFWPILAFWLPPSSYTIPCIIYSTFFWKLTPNVINCTDESCVSTVDLQSARDYTKLLQRRSRLLTVKGFQPLRKEQKKPIAVIRCFVGIFVLDWLLFFDVLPML